MTLIIFIIILSVLVLIHELGHFIAAKINGVRVEEFGWGLPPRMLGKKFGETIYSINLLPFGGFVRLTGEELSEGEDDTSDLGRTGDLDPRSFASKKPGQRMTILTAGVFMNTLLAIGVFYLILFINGFKTFQIPMIFDYSFRFGHTEKIGTMVSGIQEDFPAEEAGLALGEAIIEVDGKTVSTVEQFKAYLAEKGAVPIKLTLLDLKDNTYSKTRTVEVTPKIGEESKPVIGVYLGETVSISYDTLGEKVFSGFLHAYNVLGYSYNTLKEMILLSFRTKDLAPVSDSVSGPVGIYNLVDNVLKYGGSRAWLTLLDYVGLMSLSLAVVNILPFPALDGGRMFFVMLEGVTRRKVNPKFEQTVHRFGMIFLLGFLILITIKDLFV